MVASRAGPVLQPAAASPAKPNLLFILADDLGWADVGWHRPSNYSEAHTPFLDGLVRQGIELDRHYAFKFCSPSRSALQTGRNPIHVNVNNFDPIHHNKDDPVSGFSGVPRNMTGRERPAKFEPTVAPSAGRLSVPCTFSRRLPPTSAARAPPA